MRTLLLLAILLLPGLNARGQEIDSHYKFYGFSDDLAYCAFELFIETETGEWPSISKFYFLNVDKNSYALKPSVMQDTLALEAVRAAHLKKNQAFFKQFKISGTKTGKSVPLTTDSTGRFGQPEPTDTQHFTVNGKKYAVILNKTETGNTTEYGSQVMFELLLSHDGKTQVLQKDTKVPSSRGFTIDYKIRAIYYLENKIAVFVEYHHPGFEGYPDKYILLVTGAF